MVISSLLLLIVACGEQRSVKSYAATAPRPAISPTAIALPIPTPLVSDQVTINQFVHSSSRFSINYPDNWQAVERPDGVLFIDPSDKGGYSIFFAEAAETYNAAELKQYLARFMSENLIDKPENFKLLKEKQLANGSTLAQFESLDPIFGQTINEVRIFQHKAIVFIVLISTSQIQWSLSYPQLTALVNSLSPLDTTPSQPVTPTPEPPTWVLVGPTSSEFGFVYPSNWQILLQEAHLVSVAMPEADIVFTANNYAWVGEDTTDQATQAAHLYLTKLEEKFSEVKYSDAVPFPLDTMQGVNVDFYYVNSAKVDMAGSLITAAQADKIYQIVFTAPITDYKAGLNWFNPMYKSFKVLDTRDLLVK